MLALQLAAASGQTEDVAELRERHEIEVQNRMWDKLLRWVIFGVVIATLPILFNYLIILTNGSSPQLVDLTSRGDVAAVVRDPSCGR